MLKKSASVVLASFRPSTYPRGYASGLHSLRPCWTTFLSILRDYAPITVALLARQTSGTLQYVFPLHGSSTRQNHTIGRQKKRVEDSVLHPLELTATTKLLAFAEGPLVVNDRPGF